MNKNMKMARSVAEQVSVRGGRTFYVGGYVRDKQMGIENKDIDIEVHGIPYEELSKILDSLGKRTEMGASFGIFGLKGYDLDIAMPRKEKATGRGHKDFAVYVDPFLGTKRAALRRDFTMNALMEDVLTGEIIDHFNGIPDLEKGILRHVNKDTFGEDPLRVLRGAQFAARFKFSIAGETIALAKTMDLSTLACERIFEELKKALIKADRPSIFFEEMRKMEQLNVWFPEAAQMIHVEQNPQYHPEGDVWNHSMLVLDQAAKLRDRAVNPVGLMLAALTHDFGKVLTTSVSEEGRIVSYGHEEEGIPMIRRFLKRITSEVSLNKYVLNLCRLHMKPYALAFQRAGKKATNHMFDQAMAPGDLLLLAKADYLGREGVEENRECDTFLQERLQYFNETMEKPYVKGADLVQAGLKPGKEFSEILGFAHKLRLANVEKESALRQTLAFAKSLKEK